MPTEKKTKSAQKRIVSSAKKAPLSTPLAQTESPLAIKVKKPYLITTIVIIVVVAFIYFFKSLFIVAFVNGQPITRLSIIQQLEKQGGKQVLNVAVTKLLIEQEARKKNISVSQKDVDGEVKKTEKSLASQGQTLDQALAAQGMQKADYVDQVRLQLLIQNLVGKDIKVSDKEVNDYIAANKTSFPEGSNMDQIKKTVAQQLKQQKLNEKVQAWIANLQKNAKITYFVNY